MRTISETDLILNDDGSAYHLNLFPGEVADTVITVGDQDRVAEVSKHFDRVELKRAKREFVTHTGYIGSQRVTVISTGIGTDNIDIVLNELDALINVDCRNRLVHSELRKLNIIRIGTSGAVQPDIPVDSLLVSATAFGMDALMHYYPQELYETDRQLQAAFAASIPDALRIAPYLSTADTRLLEVLAANDTQGITLTAPGFYAPQGRQVRAAGAWPQLLTHLQNFRYLGQRITNIEMETAGIYGLAAALGHRAISFNVILANRVNQVFSRQPGLVMDKYIKQILERLPLLM